MANESLMIISCEDPAIFDEIINRANAFFTGDITVKIYLAINDVAQTVLALVSEDIPVPPVKRTPVEHARVELAKLGIAESTIDGYATVLQAFADMDHSGPYDTDAVTILAKLLQSKNLTPLTDDPGEWVIYPHEGDMGNIRQNIRNPDALSYDGGKTYSLTSEGPGRPMYASVNYVFNPNG